MRFPEPRKKVQFYVDIETDQRVKLNLGKAKGYNSNDYERNFIFLTGRLTLNKDESKLVGGLMRKEDTRPKCAKCHNRVNNTKSDNYRIYKVCSTFCRKALAFK